MAKTKRGNLSTVRVEIMHCPVHNFHCIAIEHLRVIGSKCCGSWTSIARFRVSTDRLLEDIQQVIKEPHGG